MNVRLVKSSDIVAVAKIEKEVMSCPWTEDNFMDAASHDYTIFAVAEESNQVLGYGIFYLAVPEAEMPNIVVAKECQGKGVGNAILGFLLNEAAKKGVTDVFLEVRESNMPAFSLYEKYGFEPIGIRKNFYREPVENAICMHLAKLERK